MRITKTDLFSTTCEHDSVLAYSEPSLYTSFIVFAIKHVVKVHAEGRDRRGEFNILLKESIL